MNFHSDLFNNVNEKVTTNQVINLNFSPFFFYFYAKNNKTN